MLASTPIIRAYIELYFFLLWRHCSFWCKELLASHSFSFSTFSLPSTYLSLISMLNICKMCSSLAVWRLVKTFDFTSGIPYTSQESVTGCPMVFPSPSSWISDTITSLHIHSKPLHIILSNYTPKYITYWYGVVK